MCFKCGAVSHRGVSCNNVGNAELRNYIRSNNVGKCPHCGFGTEKIDGCNQMTCSKCRNQWCWICGGKYRNGHFSEANLFGCPGGQFQNNSRCGNVFMKILMLILLPLILFFGPSIYLIGNMMECCDSRNCLGKLILFFVF